MRFLAAGLAIVVAGIPMTAAAQRYPEKSIRFIAPYAPGGATDLLTRTLAQKLTESLGQTVVPDNRPGAGGNVGAEIAAKSAPDGYTILLAPVSPMAINVSLYGKKLPFNPEKDFAPITLVAKVPLVIVVNLNVPAKTMQEFIALAKSRPGQLNYSSSGSGTTQHLSGELFNLRTGIKMVHIPYRGTAPSLTALISGEVGLSFANIPAISAHVKAGRLRPLANLGPKRSDQLPLVPTMKEAGVPGVEVVVWYGVFAPAATPRDVVAKLADTIGRAARAPDMKQRLEDLGAEPVGNTPEEFSKLFREEVTRWAEVVKVSGAKAD